MTTGLTISITDELVAELEFDLEVAETTHQLEASVSRDALAALLAERAELKRDAERLKEIIAAVVREHPRRSSVRGNAPGHGHDIAGVWDSDNGELAGTECAWCKTWAIATASAGLEPEK